MTYPIARQSRPATAPSRQGQTPARANPQTGPGLCHQAHRGPSPRPGAPNNRPLCAVRCVPRPALPRALRCGVWVCVVFLCRSAHRRARRRARRRCGGGGGGRRLEALSACFALSPGPLALWCSALCPVFPRLAWPGLASPCGALSLWRSGALALWRSATAAVSGAGRGARERFAPGAGAGVLLNWPGYCAPRHCAVCAVYLYTVALYILHKASTSACYSPRQSTLIVFCRFITLLFRCFCTFCIRFWYSVIFIPRVSSISTQAYTRVYRILSHIRYSTLQYRTVVFV